MIIIKIIIIYFIQIRHTDDFPLTSIRLVSSISPIVSCLLSHSHTGSYDYLIVRLVVIWRTCDRSAMFATISRSGRILRSVFFAGGRSSYDWSYAWSRDQHRLEKIDDKIHHIEENRTTSGSNKRSIVRSIINRGPRRAIVRSIMEFCMSNRLVVPPVVRWHDQLHD